MTPAARKGLMMTQQWSAGAVLRRSRWRLASGLAVAALTCGSLAAASSASASPRMDQDSFLRPGNLLVTGSYYDVNPDVLVPGVTVLPPGCTSGCVTATNNAAYPQVFNNVLADPSFGITTPILLDQITPWGRLVSRTQVPDGTRPGDHAVTSFSSKSELALNLSTDGRDVTMMGYVATPGTVDVSNANSPGVNDPTNPATGAYYRAVVQLDQRGRFSFTETNAYSGDTGRAPILNDTNGHRVYYMAGNAGNGSNPQPDGVILGAGAQIATPQAKPESAQQPGQPTPVGSFNVTQLGDKADKIGKDPTSRCVTVYNNAVYLTKASGSNGVNTVYFIDTTGKACPDGTGLPQPGAALPTSPIAYDPSLRQSEGVTPYNMCILQGFPTTLAKSASEDAFPFGMFFANADTVYVADEGNGTATYDPATGTYSAAAAQTTAGLQKWVFNGTQWNLAYTLSTGLNLGQPYSVADYPTGDNAATGLPWAPATAGLRNT